MKEQSCTATTLAPVSGHSCTIAKTTTTTTQQKPVIRIVHLIAPEIIKTDVDNFRELVQRLTGKQLVSSCTHATKARINKIRRHNTILSPPAAIRSSTSTTTTTSRSMPAVGRAECRGVHAHGKKLILQQQNEGEKDGKTNELELWMGDDELATTTSSSSSGGFFGGLGDVEGLLFNVPPLMLNPVISSSPTLMDHAAAWKIEEGGDR